MVHLNLITTGIKPKPAQQLCRLPFTGIKINSKAGKLPGIHKMTREWRVKKVRKRNPE